MNKQRNTSSFAKIRIGGKQFHSLMKCLEGRVVWGIWLSKYFGKGTHVAFLIWPSLTLVITLVWDCVKPIVWDWRSLLAVNLLSRHSQKEKHQAKSHLCPVGRFLLLTGGKSHVGLYNERELWNGSLFRGMCDDFIAKDGLSHWL